MKTPKRNTTLRRSRPKKKRSHLPSLSQVQRDMLSMQMQADARIPATVSAAIMASMNAAANKDAETPDVVIRSLEEGERRAVTENLPIYSAILSAPANRGKQKLLAMTDAEWDALLDEDEV